MRLGKVAVRNFRSCYETTVEFSEHLTLLVGENDAGKSNIIDALRAALPPASGRRNLWFDRDRDLSYGQPDGTTIEVSREFVDLTVGEDALYAPSIVDKERTLVHTTLFDTDPKQPRRHLLSHSVGGSRVPDPEPELRERIAHVYLPPLRDAGRALDSADGNRLAEVFQSVVSADEIAAFELSANKLLGGLAEDPATRKVVDGVQTHLTSVTQPVRHRIVGVTHSEQRLRRLTRALRLHMAAVGFAPADLQGSGLGYANLLYIATVVLELERAKEFDLTLLLVEEPEAHLHPQLQSVLLSYLLEQARASASTSEASSVQPAGRVQVVATTHSPHLASSVSIRDVVVVRGRERADSSDGEASIEVGPMNTAPSPRRHETTALALATLPLSESDRRKIDRYLDATRAALLFARQVILVEGIAEAMMLHVLAEHIVYPTSLDTTDDTNRQMREQFRAISIVPVDGVDFLPYLRLLLPSQHPLVDRVVVVTDGDEGGGAQRKAVIHDEFPDHVDAGRLSVHVGETTLEAELYSSIVNEPALRKAYVDQHPKSGAKWDAVAPPPPASPAQRAQAFSKALKDRTLNLGKGDFAQVVASVVESNDGADFEIPSYLESAIRAATIPPAHAASTQEASGST